MFGPVFTACLSVTLLDLHVWRETKIRRHKMAVSCAVNNQEGVPVPLATSQSDLKKLIKVYILLGKNNGRVTKTQHTDTHTHITELFRKKKNS